MNSLHKAKRPFIRLVGPVVIILLGIFSTLGSGGGELYISPCFPFPEDWCTPTPEDTSPPTIPTQLTSEAITASSIELNWAASSDDNYVIGYKIYRDDVYIGYVSGNTTTYTDSGLESLTQYCYRVSATDNSGNESTKSNSSCATTLLDTEPPSIPTNITVTYVQTSPTEVGLMVEWSSSEDNVGIAGYKVYKNDNYLVDVSSTTYTDTNIEPFTYYCYRISAFDNLGNESDKSEPDCALTTMFLIKLGIPVSNHSIDTTNSNKLGISYTVTNYDINTKEYSSSLRYASNISGVFETTSIDSFETNTYLPDYDTSFMFDSSDYAHIAYCSYGDGYLKYANNMSGDWVIQLVDTNINLSQCEIVVDSNKNVHIVYNASGTIKYITNQSGIWDTEIIEQTNLISPYSISLAIDTSNNLHVSYYDYTNFGIDGELIYATNVSGSWVKTVVDNDGDVGINSSIAIDSGGFVHISYFDRINKRTKYASNSSGMWMIDIINNDQDTSVISSIAVDSLGKAHVSYIHDPSDALFYSNNASGNWNTYELDSASYLSSETSIAVDANNDVHIIYNNLYQYFYATTQQR
jgi:chitodextrinase